MTFASHRAAGRQRRTSARRLLAIVMLLCGCICVTSLAPSSAFGQQPADAAARPAPDADALASPLVTADALLKGRRADAWRDDAGDQWLLLDGDIKVSVGSYGFQADRAVIQISRVRQGGLIVRRLAIYLDQARTLRGAGAITAQGGRLLVTVSTSGAVKLETDLMRRQSAAQDPLVVDAAARFKRYRELLARGAAALPSAAGRDDPPTPRPPVAPPRPDQPGTDKPATPRPDQPADPDQSADADEPGASPVPPIFGKEGSISFSADKVVAQDDGRENNDQSALLLIGNVRAAYQDERGALGLTLQAESAVIFLAGDKPMDMAAGRAKADAVRGIYLEDNVIATNGDYTVRAPRVYYDLTRNRAVVLDAVLYAYDMNRRVPIYVRADKVKQLSGRSWSAEGALVTTSDFAEPHLAIGASRVTFRQEAGAGDTPRYRYTAENTTLQAGGLPFFYWPKVSGEPRQPPLRRVSAGYRESVGPVVRTDWDLFALLGREKPEGVDMVGEVDWLGDHGGALGLKLDYDRPNMVGGFRGYILPDDDGKDEIANRRDIRHDSDVRGFAHWRHRQLLRDNWELSLEAAYVSDNTFLDEFFPREATSAKPYETSIYLKKQEDDWAFSVLASGDLYNFTAQTPLLQTPGYTVEKLPEVGYYRVGTSLLGDKLTWYTETRFSRMRITPGDDSPADRGFTDAQSRLNFLISPPTTSFDSAAALAGLPRDTVHRLDSRHEIQAPMKMGFLDVVPFVVGRSTLYDQDFEDYAGEDDKHRLMGTVGVRLHTQFSQTYHDFELPLFDVHRLRHIIEPSAEVFLTGSTVNPEDLPVYDPEVEGLSEGFGVRTGLRNTLQTQRGGPGRWRNVDWIVLDTDLVLRSDDADTETDVAHFFGYHPEYALGGDHFFTNMLWQVSDSFAAVGDLTFNLEDDHVAQWRVGGAMQHTDRLSSYVQYSFIRALDSRLLSYGLTYGITPKWEASFIHVLDLEESDINRRIELTLMRRLPQMRFGIVATHDDIDDETTIGVVLIPEGTSRATPMAGTFSALGR